MALTVRLLWP
ncbi:unnamed protein product [Acanthoscelides obtectus]|uniref:Uncharacterized protein n=1 Tax=Acanthoscelides obtectus TaxID=200917 RepID=A0A9P0KDU4_ACAOB|nr:unnamed protein product [Acanthoscelides obtectus]CAK1656418.1 hypothetical protein AOBTE_LOCUS19701 [Acanthoscelides obtectus]